MADPTVTSHHAIAPRVEPGDGRDHHRRRGGHFRRRAVPYRRRRGRGRVHPPLLLPPADEAGRHVPDVPGGGERAARRHLAAGVLPRGGRRHGVVTTSEQGARRLRTGCSSSSSSTTHSTAPCATRAASARCRTRRSPTDRARAGSSRRSATWRQAHRLVGAGAARPGALHPVRALRALRRRDRRRAPDRLPGPRRHDRGEHLRGGDLHLLLQWQHRADLPGGRPHGHPLPLHRPAVGPRPGRVDMHHVRLRVPGGGAVVGQPRHPAARHRLGPGQPELAMRQGPLRLRGGELGRSPNRASRPRRWRRAPGGVVGRGAGGGSRPARGVSATSTARAPSGWSAAPGCPTRTPMPGPSWPRA